LNLTFAIIPISSCVDSQMTHRQALILQVKGHVLDWVSLGQFRLNCL